MRVDLVLIKSVGIRLSWNRRVIMRLLCEDVSNQLAFLHCVGSLVATVEAWENVARGYLLLFTG